MMGAWLRMAARDEGVEDLQIIRIDVQDRLWITTHPAFQLVDLLEREEALANDTLRLVELHVVVDDLGGDAEGRDK